MFFIVAGSYERLLYGLSGNLAHACTQEKKEQKNSSTFTIPALTPEFIYPAHISSLKSLSMNQRFLVSGSSDEHIKIYDLKLRKEVGTLMHHTGSITCLAFYKKSHLISASEDGQICIIRTSDWEVLKTLQGHRHAVLSLSIHPSGKIMLSTGKDGTLKCWDLEKGSCAYSMKLPQLGDKVLWSPTGDHYAILMDKTLWIYQVSTGECTAKIATSSRMNSFVFTTGVNPDEPILITGEENQTCSIWDLKGDLILKWETKDGARVKDMSVFITNEPEKAHLLATCASNGKIKVWELSKLLTFCLKETKEEILPLVEYDAKCRLTCLIMSSFVASHSQKRKEESLKENVLAEDSGLSDMETELKRKKPKVKVTFEK
jgi:protein MAK11